MTEPLPDSSTKWKELKTKFLRDFLPEEQAFFLKKARECVGERGYPASEELFNYCSFLTIRERLRLIGSGDGDGLMRFMLVELHKEIEDEVKVLEKRLEAQKRPVADGQGVLLLEYLGRK